MTDEDFLRKLREAFSIEADEHLQAITTGLLEIEKQPPAPRKKEIVETIFRDAHSLKGAARAVSRADIESVCQALESVFSQWKQKDTPVSEETFDVLNHAVDMLAGLLRMPAAASGAAERAAIKDLTHRLGRAPSPTQAPAPAAPTGGHGPETTAATPAAPETEQNAPAEPDTTQIAETVRIRMAKMDDLLRRAEEMVAVKLAAARNASELRGLGGILMAWRKEWAKVRDVARASSPDRGPAELAKLFEFLDWNQGYMHSIEKRIGVLTSSAERDERSIAGHVDNLLNGAKRLVMLPFGTLFDIFPKIVRDLTRAQGKAIDLIIQGRDIEIDKRILQEMKDPLIHLVRNSIDHGLENAADRAAAGKAPTGTLTLSVAQLDGSKVEITVADDGAGIDVERVKASAVETGGISPEEARSLSEHAALSLIFASGVSTSPIITEISGRGLGMAIVREKVDKLGGQISIESVRGRGTKFRIVLPVTLATFKGILVSVGGQIFVIPTSRIEHITRVRRDSIRTVENRETIAFEGRALALARLDVVLGLPPRPAAGPMIEVIILGSAEKHVAFAVDDVLNEQEVLVKIIGKPLTRVRNVAGATILSSGAPAIILNTNDLIQSAVTAAAAPRLDSSLEAATPPRRILVADDSVTSRMLLKNILDSAGYRVTTAVDGAEALAALKSREFDLLVSDVEMPRMDGFELTAKVRADQKLEELPVVLVTALGSRSDQERGIDAGANAYIVKGSFDQSNLLEVVRKLVA